MQVLDDTGKEITVYIAADGGVRTDIRKVQEELEDQGLFRGMHDTWDVDFDELEEEEDESDDSEPEVHSESDFEFNEEEEEEESSSEDDPLMDEEEEMLDKYDD